MMRKITYLHTIFFGVLTVLLMGVHSLGVANSMLAMRDMPHVQTLALPQIPQTIHYGPLVDPFVPKIDEHLALPMMKTAQVSQEYDSQVVADQHSFHIRAIVVGGHPCALVDDGSGDHLVHVGDMLNGAKIQRIRLESIDTADGRHFSANGSTQ